MDEDRLKGSATNLGGKVKEGAGKLTGDQKLQARASSSRQGRGPKRRWRHRGAIKGKS